MGERVPLHRSVFTRLVAVMVAAALSLLAIVVGLFVAAVGPSIYMLRRVADDHARLLATTAPDEARARELAARLDVKIRYEGSGGTWSTSPDLPAIGDVERAAAKGADGPLHGLDYTIAAGPGGGKYIFLWGYEQRLREAHNRFLGLALALIAGIILLAHEVIRRSLRPLRTLRDGVARLSQGELDVVLPSAPRDEFGSLTEAFNTMVGRVREMVTARDRLLRDVSHELRSPLSRMKVALALLPETDKRRRMEADVAEMGNLVAELLELERLRDGRALQLGRHDLVPILRSSAEAFQDQPPGVFVEASGELLARVDPDKVRTVLGNLLENASKYALPDSAPVTVSAARDGSSVLVRVRDDGPGIPEADRGSLFDPFFRVDRSRSRKTGGYGLGLAICKRVMEAHGGEIALESSGGRGAIFVLRFRAED